jgi:hypothetical protein
LFLPKPYFSFEALDLSYRGNSKSSYGNQRRGSGSFRGSSKYRPVEEIETERTSVLNFLHEKEKAVDRGKMSREDYENYREYVLKEGMPNRIDLSPFVYRTTIGHYGGLFIEVPVEVFAEFKEMWPASEFPRRVESKDVVEMNGPSGLSYFHKTFPHYSGKIKQVFFANGSKGEKRIDISMKLPHERETNPGD